MCSAAEAAASVVGCCAWPSYSVRQGCRPQPAEALHRPLPLAAARAFAAAGAPAVAFAAASGRSPASTVQNQNKNV